MLSIHAELYELPGAGGTSASSTAPRAAAAAGVFSEIYGGPPRPLPASVTDALAALDLARHQRTASTNARWL